MTSMFDEMIKIGLKDFFAYTITELKESIPKEKQYRLSKAYIAYLEAQEKANNEKFEKELKELRVSLQTTLQENDPPKYKQKEIDILFEKEQQLIEGEIQTLFPKMSHARVFLKNLEGAYIPTRWMYIIRACTEPAFRHLAIDQLSETMSDFSIVKAFSNDFLIEEKRLPLCIFANYAWKYLEKNAEGHNLKDLYYFGLLYQSIEKLYKNMQSVSKQVVQESPRSKSPRNGGWGGGGSSASLSSTVLVTPRPESSFRIELFPEVLQHLSLPTAAPSPTPTPRKLRASTPDKSVKEIPIQSLKEISSSITVFLKSGGAAWGSTLTKMKKIDEVFKAIIAKLEGDK